MIGALPPAPPATDGRGFTSLPAPRLFSRDDALFPARLQSLADCPATLWMRFASDDAALHDLWTCATVAIVGSRAAGHAGMAIARGLAWEVGRAGVVVVSGLARGIDAAAHEGALLAGGPTIAVLASGLDSCYPPEHESLATDIARAGVLISEWPAGTPPVGWRFPRRNRLLSGLADVIVVVEGAADSGTLHTVRFAAEQGREVMAVPRDPLGPGAEAPNRLIRDGATPATSAADVLALLEMMPDRAPDGDAAQTAEPKRLTGQKPPATQKSLDEPKAKPKRMPVERNALRARLLAHLGRDGALSFDALAARLPEMSASALSAQLVALEVEGRLARDRHGCFRLHQPV